MLHLPTHLPVDEPCPCRTFYYADPDMVTDILTTILDAVNTLETQFLDLDSPRSRLTRGRGRATAAWSEKWGSTSF